MQMPPDYRAYLRNASSAFGDLACDDFDRYFELWPESDSEQFNKEYEVQKLAPGFVAFATNGGGELYAFDLGGRVFEIPCIGMSAQEAALVATSWQDFEARIKNAGEQGGGGNSAALRASP